jgi:hypothetical protein
MSSSRFKFSVKPQEAILILITMFWGGTFLAVSMRSPERSFFCCVLHAALAVALLSQTCVDA